MPLCWSGAGTGPGDAVLAQELPALLWLPSRAGKDTGRQKGLSQVLLVRDRTPSGGSTGCLGAEGRTGLVQHPHNTQRGKGQGSLASRRIRPDTAPDKAAAWDRARCGRSGGSPPRAGTAVTQGDFGGGMPTWQLQE